MMREFDILVSQERRKECYRVQKRKKYSIKIDDNVFPLGYPLSKI